MSRVNAASPAQVLVAGFAALILIGAVILALPVSSRDGKALPFVDALFTATSAVCVTGLVVVDTHDQFSLFGQLVILCLIQVGGLGIMTVSTLIFLLLGRRVTLRSRLLIQEAMNQLTLEGMVRLIRKVLLVTAVVEGFGALLLAIRWSFDMGFPRCLYYGVFHAVSGFCNAGFDLFGGFRSLTGYAADVWVNLVMTGLIIIGGLGFSVVSEVIAHRRGCKLSLHARVVLLTTAVLIAAGTVVIFLLELDNPATLKPLSPLGKALSAYFQAVTPRTAGFNTLPIGDMRAATQLFIIILMFIGASPGSTGGGIKTSTFATLLLAVRSVVRGREDVEVFERRVPHRIVYRALAVSMISLALVIVITMALSIVRHDGLLPVLFEATSAFGTVGLSMGITPSLSALGKVLIIFTMFAGRVGPLTVATAIAQRQHAANAVRYPEERVMVG
ncbi:MAG: Trk family potassium uptake protein [Firmicutes bacterium]|nr:Trk family potassium uptake protein [Bacillota bacterium]